MSTSLFLSINFGLRTLLKLCETKGIDAYVETLLSSKLQENSKSV